MRTSASCLTYLQEPLSRAPEPRPNLALPTKFDHAVRPEELTVPVMVDPSGPEYPAPIHRAILEVPCEPAIVPRLSHVALMAEPTQVLQG